MRSWKPKTRLICALCLPALSLATVACGEASDPFAEDGETGGDDASASASSATSGDSSGATTSTDTGTDTGTTTTDTSGSGETGGTTDTGDTGETTGGNACAPAPTRFVVLGDSVPAGVGTNGPGGDRNAFKMMHAYVEGSYAAGSLTFENYSVGGAQTADVPDNQLQNIPTGMPGHVLVNIHIGGNDLAGYIFDTDANAQADFPSLTAEALDDWATIWAFFEDPANFPDGATVVVNTQYNPFDDCDSPHTGVSLSDIKSGLLNDYNDIIKDNTAMHPIGIIADQHPGFLGHGHNYDNPECATYTGGDYWMVGGFDFIHANQAGHAGMALVFNDVADDLYLNCE